MDSVARDRSNSASTFPVIRCLHEMTKGSTQHPIRLRTGMELSIRWVDAQNHEHRAMKNAFRRRISFRVHNKRGFQSPFLQKPSSRRGRRKVTRMKSPFHDRVAIKLTS